MFGPISEGWALTRDSLLDATGQSRLLAHSPALDASIRLRLPYIEPLNLLQVDLIRRLRGGDSDEKVVTGLQLTINAIATALKIGRASCRGSVCQYVSISVVAGTLTKKK